MAQVLSPGALPEPTYAPVQPEEWQENLNVRLICKECKEDPPNLFEDLQNGDTICESCGIVLGQRGIDNRAEWRTFANDDQGNNDPSRVGDDYNPLLNGSQLQTNISFGDGSMRSKELHRAQNKATADKNNKTLLQAFKQIGAYCDAYGIPPVVSDGAKHIFKDADESKLFRGKSQEAIIAGCIFIACRRNGVARSFQEIFQLTRVSKKEIGRTFKLLEKFLMNQDKNKKSSGLTANGEFVISFTMTIIDIGSQGVTAADTYQATALSNPSDLCARYCSMLHLDQRCTNVAIAIASKMFSVGALAGRSPLSCAGACIYMASCLMGQARTPKQIGDVARVTDSTIRSAYKSLYAERETLVDAEILQRGVSLDNLPQPVSS